MSIKLDRKTLEEKILRRCKILGYSFVKWKNENDTCTRAKIILNCPEHGEFEILYNSFVNKKTLCNHCGHKFAGLNQRISRETLETRIFSQCKLLGYEFLGWVNDIGPKKKIILKCPEHGEFEIWYNSFIIRNSKCRKCANENGWLKNRIDDDTVLQNILNHCKTINAKFLNFDNENNQYEGRETKIRLFCPNCNNEWITTYSCFINYKTNCPNCNKWTFEKCNEIAKQYTMLNDFRKNNNGAYQAALKYNWFDNPNFHQLLNINDYTEYDDKLIYAYFFEKDNIKYVYIGLTNNIKMRHKNHKIPISTVYQFAKQHGLEIPEPVILTEMMSPEKASIEEGIQLQKYIDLGYKKLNKASTGGLGAYSH
jgi:uncharacterized protein (DUF983 family)/predicted GIY-YIG superfamily endonuclease